MSYKVGVICPSEIAFRRFLPSLQRVKEFEFAGVAIASPEEWDLRVCEGKSQNVFADISILRIKSLPVIFFDFHSP